MAERKAGAVWNGGLKGGTGTMKTESGVVDGPYSFGSRFESGGGTNPEELVAAALAGCFSMALAASLERAGTPATRVATDATATIEKVEAGFRITKMHLRVRGTVPGVSAETFVQAASATKDGCIVSQLYKGNTQLTMDATLE